MSDGVAGRDRDETGHEPVAAVDAATTVLVRDASGGGVEVLLLERHQRSDFAAGALVFPGGKVDAHDRALTAERWHRTDIDAWSRIMGAGSRQNGLGLLVAAVRETFEEVGVLLARHPDGTRVTAEDLARPTFRWARERLAVRGEHWDWRPWLQEERLTLDLECLAPWSWWVTPSGRPKRFDTRFFIAVAPADQVALHDGIEATASMWLRPQDALRAQERGEATVIFPTRRNLEQLARFPDAVSAWRAARDGATDLRRIQPTIVEVEGVAMVQHPFEERPVPR